jgi:hypothetical protein
MTVSRIMILGSEMIMLIIMILKQIQSSRR